MVFAGCLGVNFGCWLYELLPSPYGRQAAIDHRSLQRYGGGGRLRRPAIGGDHLAPRGSESRDCTPMPSSAASRSSRPSAAEDRQASGSPRECSIKGRSQGVQLGNHAVVARHMRPGCTESIVNLSALENGLLQSARRAKIPFQAGSIVRRVRSYHSQIQANGRCYFGATLYLNSAHFVAILCDL
jgi:hypothetical protein